MVSALGSGSRGLASTPGQVNVLCSWAKHFILSTKEQKYQGSLINWLEVEWGGDLVMDQHPIQW